MGQVDIDCEVSMMSSHMALPREGHLKELFHIFAYLKAHANAEMVFDLTPILPDKSLFDVKIGHILHMAMSPSRKSFHLICHNHMVRQ